LASGCAQISAGSSVFKIRLAIVSVSGFPIGSSSSQEGGL
jgi:hypothetical protein